MRCFFRASLVMYSSCRQSQSLSLIHIYEDIQDYLVLQVVVKEENKDAAWAKAIVDAYHSDEFKKYMEENNDGLWWIPDELK